MKKVYHSNSDAETARIAKEVVHYLQKKGNTILGLTGDLGAGKTTFTKALLKELGVKGRIVSPTFIITKSYKANFNEGRKNINHIDAYRIDSKKDLEGTGIKEAIEDTSSTSIIEWADKIKDILPPRTIWIQFKYGEKTNERDIIIN